MSASTVAGLAFLLAGALIVYVGVLRPLSLKAGPRRHCPACGGSGEKATFGGGLRFCERCGGQGLILRWGAAGYDRPRRTGRRWG